MRQFQYPCIGMFRFLDLSLKESPAYGEIVQRLKGGDKLLDLGCCFGQEIRDLVFQGVPAENIFGSDLRQEFVDLGYDLFLDRGKLATTFIVGDAMDPKSELSSLNGKVNIIHATSFLHLFNWEDQVTLGKRFVEILSAKPGSMVVGRQVGNVNPGEHARKAGAGTRYRHDGQSFDRMWQQIGEETGTKWKVQAALDDDGQVFDKRRAEARENWNPEGTRRLSFVVVRE